MEFDNNTCPFPILEFDNSTEVAISPQHESLNLSLPPKAVFAFLGDEIESFANRHGATPISHFVSSTKKYPIYLIDWNGERVCLCQAPVGSSASTQMLDWLYAYGVHTVISAGSCGVLSFFPENYILVPTHALRDEGTSYHYLKPSRYVQLDDDCVKQIASYLSLNGIHFSLCKTWSTDGFFRETINKINSRKEEGCQTVEMECAALAACAIYRGKKFGMLLYAADLLENPNEIDERTWGIDSKQSILPLCLDILSSLHFNSF